MTGAIIAPLPREAVRRISAGQVVTSVLSVAKELVENALDANATAIDVRLEGGGLDVIAVTDNGSGIAAANRATVANRYCTSKISAFEDLALVTSYGFRGEALNSICNVAQVFISTRTAADDVGCELQFHPDGTIASEHTTSMPQGTSIVVKNLFHAVPVRRQLLKKQSKVELAKIEEMIIAYSLIHPGVRFSLRSQGKVVFQKAAVSDVKCALVTVFGNKLASQLVFVHSPMSTTDGIEVKGYVPAFTSDPNITTRSTNDRCFIFVNKRPVQVKEINAAIRIGLESSAPSEGRRYPFVFLDITMPTNEYDVNVEPSKSTIMLHNDKALAERIGSLLSQLYEPNLASDSNPKLESSAINTASSLLANQGSDDFIPQNRTPIVATSEPTFTSCKKNESDLLNIGSGDLDVSSMVRSTSTSNSEEKPVHLGKSTIDHLGKFDKNASKPLSLNNSNINRLESSPHSLPPQKPSADSSPFLNAARSEGYYEPNLNPNTSAITTELPISKSSGDLISSSSLLSSLSFDHPICKSSSDRVLSNDHPDSKSGTAFSMTSRALASPGSLSSTNLRSERHEAIEIESLSSDAQSKKSSTTWRSERTGPIDMESLSKKSSTLTIHSDDSESNPVKTSKKRKAEEDLGRTQLSLPMMLAAISESGAAAAAATAPSSSLSSSTSLLSSSSSTSLLSSSSSTSLLPSLSPAPLSAKTPASKSSNTSPPPASLASSSASTSLLTSSSTGASVLQMARNDVCGAIETVTFDSSEIRGRYSRGFKCSRTATSSHESNTISVVGKLPKSGLWIIKLGMSGLWAIDIIRCQEAYYWNSFKKSNAPLVPEALQAPLFLDAEILESPARFQRLCELPVELVDGSQIVKHPLLESNGFRILKRTDASGRLSVLSLIAKPPALQIQDLIYILDHLCEHDSIEYRPPGAYRLLMKTAAENAIRRSQSMQHHDVIMALEQTMSLFRVQNSNRTTSANYESILTSSDCLCPHGNVLGKRLHQEMENVD